MDQYISTHRSKYKMHSQNEISECSGCMAASASDRIRAYRLVVGGSGTCRPILMKYVALPMGILIEFLDN